METKIRREQILSRISTIRKQAEQNKNSHKYMEHHHRLSKIRLDYLEEDMASFFDLIQSYDTKKDESIYKRILVKTYYILTEDIMHGITFDFVGAKEINKEIITIFHLFKDMFTTITFQSTMHADNLLTTARIITMEFNVVDAQIRIFHDEESILNQCMNTNASNVMNSEKHRMMKMHAAIEMLFTEIHNALRLAYPQCLEQGKTRIEMKKIVITSCDKVIAQCKTIPGFTHIIMVLKQTEQELITGCHIQDF